MRVAAALLAFSVAALAAPDFTVELGRRLFMDPTVSRTGRVSCSSCHLPEHGFSDPRALSQDENGWTRRHSQPILDLKGSRMLHWDGEFASVRELIDARLAPEWRRNAIAGETRMRRFKEARAAGRRPDEERFRCATRGSLGYGGARGNGLESATLLRRLAVDRRYDLAFRAAFGTPTITADRIAEALEAYVLSLRSGTNAFDRGALTEAQQRGLALFRGKANCAACHVGERLTDGSFHDTGIGRSCEGPCAMAPADLGAADINFVPADEFKFKTPSLKDVARRAPYMHDGSFATLEDVVRYYNGGGRGGRELDPHVRPLGLSDGEIEDLVAFLHALTSDERPGLGPARARPHRTNLRIVDLEGRPLRRLTVEIHPAGDRLADHLPAEGPRTVLTDMHGCLSFDFPAWTHVRLVADRFELHYDWLIPDSVSSMEVIAASKTKVALRLRTPSDQRPASLDVAAKATRGTPTTVVTHFRLARKLADGSALYVEERGPLGPVTAPRRRTIIADVRAPRPDGVLLTVARGCELDLSGGWAEPMDTRPDPELCGPAGCCGTCFVSDDE